LAQVQVNKLQTFSVQQLEFRCNRFTVWFNTMQWHWVISKNIIITSCSLVHTAIFKCNINNRLITVRQ